jgi:hypothetical protein
MTQILQASPPGQVAGQPKYVLNEADKKRVLDIQAAWKAYSGELDPPLQKLAGQPDDNVLSNRIRAIVDRGIDFLFGKEIEISVEERAPQEAQDIINKSWGRKEARIPLLQKLAANGAIAGQAFLRIVPEPKNTYRLVVVDPATVFVQTAPQDCETVLLYCIEYSTTELVNGKPAQVFYREEMSRIDPDNDGDNGDPFADTDATWSINHWSRVGDRGNWTPAPGGALSWPYPFPPLFSCQNLPMPNEYWGIPDVTPDLIGNNEDLNLVQSCINRILKLYGSPIIYATGTGESTIDIKPGKIIGLPLSESKIVAVTLASDVANALAFAANIRADMDEQSSVPGVATGRIEAMPRGALSGIAIELLFMPLLKKTDKKTCLFGRLIIDVSKALLILNNITEKIELELAWPSPLPHDDLPAVQAAISKKELNISTATLLRELGYDPEEEAKLLEAEEDAKLEKQLDAQAQLPPDLPGVKPLPGQPPAAPAAQQPTSPFIGGGNG